MNTTKIESMETKTLQAFDAVTCRDHPFVKELFKKTRAAAKKYDSAIRAQQKQKEGGKLDSDQLKKVQQKDSFKKSVEDAFETLALFSKTYVPAEPTPAPAAEASKEEEPEVQTETPEPPVEEEAPVEEAK
jgi:hypothetical protein